mmetsp:Transcript_34531/g.67950  ORF Transcript_34531/g.67950 Transcript_34531/m.67950 type:complete len:407 (+) Transcript_34531:335-1555(+)|eukprot:CAMPEP_0194324602 /NCGR_PEP_ID=MMETSP0171-20130528/28687_1 /TAXON_ID=218684 /ORGANISM="Corethron pennatum, Strain L29A3" /LENGTH=406 /DNA_ID=CAMNT_0039083541 /DNA_START=300 /DNA_END=1520 /DNA_ORIENTATION=+
MFLRLICGALPLLLSRASAHQSGDWIDAPSLPTTGRSDMTATTIDHSAMDDARGPILIAGGCISGNLFLEDPGFHDCVEITDELLSFVPGRGEVNGAVEGTYEVRTPMPRARSRHTAVDVGGKLWIVGGRGSDGAVVKEIDVYDFATDKWETPATFEAAASDQASFTVGTSVYIVGGWPEDYSSVLSEVYIFDTAEAAVAGGGAVVTTNASSLNVARGDIHAVVLDGYAYVVGGFTIDCSDGPLRSMERYDIANDVWEEVGELRSPRGDLALVELNQKVYMVGGEHNNNCAKTKPFSSAFDDVEVLDVETNTWTKEQDIPFERFRFSAAPYPSDGAIYIFGGQMNLNEDNAYPVSDGVHVLFENLDDHEEVNAMGSTVGSGVASSYGGHRITAAISFVGATFTIFL